MDKPMLITVENITLLKPTVSKALVEFEKQVEEIKAKQDELKQRILEEMEAKGIIKIETDDLSITYIAPAIRETFDKKKFRKDNPDLYDEYVSISSVKSSIRMKVKEER